MNVRTRRINEIETATIKCMSDPELEALADTGPNPDFTGWSDADLERVIAGGPLPTHRGSRRTVED